MQVPDEVRLDKWLWAARLFKTRTLATDEVNRGRISVNGQAVKPSRDLKVGDRVTIRQGGGVERVIDVLGLSAQRGPAPVAQALYAETAASLEARRVAAQARRLGAEPALSIEQGRPTKRDRRQLGDWQRWSAALDD
ncbi:MAG TPA: RNA-binding S4 domain-containing protein [Rubrivivax sp.]